jgi:hypothetical protein
MIEVVELSDEEEEDVFAFWLCYHQQIKSTNSTLLGCFYDIWG